MICWSQLPTQTEVGKREVKTNWVPSPRIISRQPMRTSRMKKRKARKKLMNRGA